VREQLEKQLKALEESRRVEVELKTAVPVGEYAIARK
jgi:hypothetical protein